MSVSPRILCLPGYLQSGRVFAEKSSGLRKTLTKKLQFELDYIDPPFVLQDKDELPFPLSSDPAEAEEKWNSIVEKNANRCWWNNNDQNVYVGFDTSLAFVINYIKENGPYDGIMGFSQGAAMSAIVSNAITDLFPSHPNFKIAVLFSAFAFTQPKDPKDDKWALNQLEDLQLYTTKMMLNPIYENYYAKTNKETQIISIYGCNDLVVTPIRSKHLASLYDPNSSAVFEHDGGHFIPNNKTFLNPILDQFKLAFDSKSNL